ncbi:unnamed protein product [Pleuronectes platessa]|uniref:Uncharacterized protein n=1 Tax=Pleuronectes platessa TaxID=8262 RepID=A0A9N7URT3_PLEPL|nr:unnamed protein product [Pleuronectes platessa]
MHEWKEAYMQTLERRGNERRGEERRGEERRGEERKGKERKGKERKGKEMMWTRDEVEKEKVSLFLSRRLYLHPFPTASRFPLLSLSTGAEAWQIAAGAAGNKAKSVQERQEHQTKRLYAPPARQWGKGGQTDACKQISNIRSNAGVKPKDSRLGLFTFGDGSNTTCLLW